MQFPIPTAPNSKTQITPPLGKVFDAENLATAVIVIYQPAELLLKIGIEGKNMHGPEISIR
jgi:hypothetical protein